MARRAANTDMISSDTIREVRKIRSLTKRADRLAESAHAGQVRRGTDGQPYVEHCRRVARAALDVFKPANLHALGLNPHDVAAAALLHDAVEDAGVIPALLLQAGISSVAVDWVHVLTRPKVEPYDDYIRRILNASTAVKLIKICDIVDNLADEPSNAQVEKYRRALVILCGI